jgi:uncharacterized protein (DUF2141 family)
MKRYFIMTAILSLLALATMAQEKDTGIKIDLKINGLSNNQGKLMIALYNSESSFLNKPYMTSAGVITNKESSVVFNNIKPGTYAISCYHDQNSNQQLDFNGMGIPKEPTAASNDAKGFFGPPKFKDAKFEIKSKSKNLIINF